MLKLVLYPKKFDMLKKHTQGVGHSKNAKKFFWFNLKNISLTVL